MIVRHEMKNKGFTLVELLAVMSIMSLILVLLITNITDPANSTKETISKSKIETIKANVLKDAEKTINSKAGCTGKITSTKTACIYDAKTYLQEIDSKDSSIDGKVYICYNNSKLEITANYSTADSYNCG